MFEKNLNIGYLLDFYGDVLTERKKDALDSYYNNDMSLSEIADEMSISRQGVRHIIKKGEEYLFFLESKLGLASHYSELQLAIDKLNRVRESIASGVNLEESDKIILEVISTIQNKGI
jgi:predicted DNA-binding protein YlxM (UPF0122 family)